MRKIQEIFETSYPDDPPLSQSEDGIKGWMKVGLSRDGHDLVGTHQYIVSNLTFEAGKGYFGAASEKDVEQWWAKREEEERVEQSGALASGVVSEKSGA